MLLPLYRPLTSNNLSRRDQVVACRLRIDHSSYAHLLKHEPSPVYNYCSTPVTIAHILVHCPHYASIGYTYYHTTDMYTLFKNTPLLKSPKYIKGIGIIYQFIWVCPSRIRHVSPIQSYFTHYLLTLPLCFYTVPVFHVVTVFLPTLP